MRGERKRDHKENGSSSLQTDLWVFKGVRIITSVAIPKSLGWNPIQYGSSIRCDSVAIGFPGEMQLGVLSELASCESTLAMGLLTRGA